MPSEHRILGTLIALASMLGSPAASPGRPGLPGRMLPSEESLEALLARLRHERDQARETLTGRVAQYVEELEALSSAPDERKLAATRAALTALGPEASPLLVEWIAPGREDPAAEFRAQAVTAVLASARPSSITSRLLEIVGGKDPAAGLNALEILARTPEPERVVEALSALYHERGGAMRVAVLSTLARLGGPRSQELVSHALSLGDDELIDAALGALTQPGGEQAAGAVLELSRGPTAPRHVERILGYYRAHPQALGKAHVLALVELAGHVAVPERQRARLLDSLAGFPLELDAELRRALEPIAERGTRQARESSLVLLCVLGDSGSRRALFKPYDEAVKANDGRASSWADRALIHYRVKDYRRAISDFKEALELQAEARQHDSETHLGIARCYALQGDFRKAETYIDSAQLALRRRQQLGAEDPDFARMAEDSRYRRVFYLDSQE